ncbi:MAG: DUF3301 domain-containing protein [Rhodanobacteraceae bacterium]
MLDIWLPLLAVGVIVACWYHVLRLRERMTGHARRLCERHGLQLLDDSVALHRLRIVRRRGALCVLREYRFDVSTGGHDRRTARVTFLGDRVVTESLPARQSDDTAAPRPFAATRRMSPPSVTVTVTDRDDNVIPITRARRTLH